MYSVLPFQEHGHIGTLIYKKKTDIRKGRNLPGDRNQTFQMAEGNNNKSNNKIKSSQNNQNAVNKPQK